MLQPQLAASTMEGSAAIVMTRRVVRSPNTLEFVSSVGDHVTVKPTDDERSEPAWLIVGHSLSGHYSVKTECRSSPTVSENFDVMCYVVLQVARHSKDSVRA